MRFICKNCKYRFESSLNATQKNCPYCGEKKVREELSANELLDESEEF